MKKILSILLVLLFLSGFCTVFAEESIENTIDFPKYGFSFSYPEVFTNLKGQLLWVDSDDYLSLWYIAATDEQIEASGIDFPTVVQGSSEAYDLTVKLNAPFEQLFDIDVEDLIPGASYDWAWGGSTVGMYLTDTRSYSIHVTGSIDYFIKMYFSQFDEAFADECVILHNSGKAFASGVKPDSDSTYMPFGYELQPEEKKQIVFETTDLDGNPVSSEKLFSKAKVTMIHIWATWCEPCHEDLKWVDQDLKLYAQKGCQVIGICDDATGSTTANAKQLTSEISFLNLQPPAGLDQLFGKYAYPVNFFVDSEGNMLVRNVGQGSAGISQALEAALREIGEEGFTVLP